jgi:hypothetical protein
MPEARELGQSIEILNVELFKNGDRNNNKDNRI